MKRMDPRLYILMRTDLESMNPGKAVAQGAHAATKFILEFKSRRHSASMNRLFRNWAGKRGFGTKITLSVSGPDIYQIAKAAKQYGAVFGIVHDPTYPIADGTVRHHIPLDTCAYIFGDAEDMKDYVGGLRLMR